MVVFETNIEIIRNIRTDSDSGVMVAVLYFIYQQILVNRLDVLRLKVGLCRLKFNEGTERKKTEK